MQHNIPMSAFGNRTKDMRWIVWNIVISPIGLGVLLLLFFLVVFAWLGGGCFCFLVFFLRDKHSKSIIYIYLKLYIQMITAMDIEVVYTVNVHKDSKICKTNSGFKGNISVKNWILMYLFTGTKNIYTLDKLKFRYVFIGLGLVLLMD